MADLSTARLHSVFSVTLALDGKTFTLIFKDGGDVVKANRRQAYAARGIGDTDPFGSDSISGTVIGTAENIEAIQEIWAIQNRDIYGSLTHYFTNFVAQKMSRKETFSHAVLQHATETPAMAPGSEPLVQVDFSLNNYESDNTFINVRLS